MQKIEFRYGDPIRQNVNCSGTIKNVSKGLIIKLVTKDYVTKEEFLICFLKRFRSTYDIYPDHYNQKEYRRFLKNEIVDVRQRLEQLEFAHKICGRKILEGEV